jgi:hypothetical protein
VARNEPLRKKSKETLHKVLEDAGDTALREFVAGLRRDVSAGQPAFDLPPTTRPTHFISYTRRRPVRFGIVFLDPSPRL